MTERHSLASVWKIAALGLLVRLAYMTLAHTWRVRPYGNHFQFGWEMGRIARALDTGYGYSDPFHGHTGPTAWVTPAFPLIIAAVFKLTGIYTPLSAWLLLAFNSVLSAIMVRTTWEIADRCYGPRVALWSAWIWALYPAAMQYAVKWIWEMTLTAFLFSWVLVLALRMRGIGDPPGSGRPVEELQTPRRWALFGLLWGLIALSNPAILIFLPVCGLWVLAGAWTAPVSTGASSSANRAEVQTAIATPARLEAQAPGPTRLAAEPLHQSARKPGPVWPRLLGSTALAAVIFLALVAPWGYRNWHAFHHFVPMRGNFGAELYLGNGPGAVGLLMEYNHPGEAPEQLRLYKQMGEVQYVAWRGGIAKRMIAADTPRFVDLCLRRVYYMWFSVPHPADDAPWVEYGRSLNFQFSSIAGLLGLAVALRRRMPAAWLFAWAFLLLPLMYYFVAAHARFRHPFEPLIAILGVYLFQSAEKSWRVGSWRERERAA